MFSMNVVNSVVIRARNTTVFVPAKLNSGISRTKALPFAASHSSPSFISCTRNNCCRGGNTHINKRTPPPPTVPASKMIHTWGAIHTRGAWGNKQTKHNALGRAPLPGTCTHNTPSHVSTPTPHTSSPSDYAHFNRGFRCHNGLGGLQLSALLQGGHQTPFTPSRTVSQGPGKLLALRSTTYTRPQAHAPHNKYNMLSWVAQPMPLLHTHCSRELTTVGKKQSTLFLQRVLRRRRSGRSLRHPWRGHLPQCECCKAQPANARYGCY